MRRFFGFVLAVILAAVWGTGCESEPALEELGTLHREVPIVPGAEEPYELPEVESPYSSRPENAPAQAEGDQPAEQ